MKIFIALAFIFSTAQAAQPLPYEKPQKMETGKALEFADFVVTYEGAKEKAEPAHAREDVYEVKSKKHGTQKLVIKSGQAPPMPFDFSVGKQKFTLFTYSLPGTRIEPKEFAIFKKPSDRR